MAAMSLTMRSKSGASELRQSAAVTVDRRLVVEVLQIIAAHRAGLQLVIGAGAGLAVGNARVDAVGHARWLPDWRAPAPRRRR